MQNEELTNHEVPELSPDGMSRRKFLHLSVVGVSSLVVAGCVGGIATRNNIEITKLTIVLPNLPPSFRGTTITLASDIHAGPYMTEGNLRNVVQKINELKSDIILLPGDFVTTHRNELPPIIETFHELRAPLGVYATTGNHEYYVDADLVSRGIEECGIKMMRNENFAIEKNGEKLHILAVDDKDADDIVPYLEGEPAEHIDATYRGVPENAATILMNHKPYRFDEYAKTGIGLMLSGHTHGGQIVFARIGETNFSFSRFASHYVEGHFEKMNDGKHSQMYVTRGIGTVGLPMRFNCPPEITQITLA